MFSLDFFLRIRIFCAAVNSMFLFHRERLVARNDLTPCRPVPRQLHVLAVSPVSTTGPPRPPPGRRASPPWCGHIGHSTLGRRWQSGRPCLAAPSWACVRLASSGVRAGFASSGPASWTSVAGAHRGIRRLATPRGRWLAGHSRFHWKVWRPRTPRSAPWLAARCPAVSPDPVWQCSVKDSRTECLEADVGLLRFWSLGLTDVRVKALPRPLPPAVPWRVVSPDAGDVCVLFPP